MLHAMLHAMWLHAMWLGEITIRHRQERLEPNNRETPGLLAVRVAPEAREAAQRSNAPATCGTIQIELTKGTMRIVGIVDAASLHTVLEYLTR